MQKVTKKALGNEAEQRAADRLMKQWVEIVDRNWVMRWGEIDIIGKQDDVLLIIEVKSVASREDVYEYLSKKKISHVEHSATVWMKQHNRLWPVRIDAVYVYSEYIHRYQNITNS